ncbi:MAG: DUF951 domain-containing protein [Eubacteriales bacterium]
MDPQIKENDVVMMKKAHPCGTNAWKVIRTGMDVKLKCTGCGRMVMLKHSDFKKGFKRRINS